MEKFGEIRSDVVENWGHVYVDTWRWNIKPLSKKSFITFNIEYNFLIFCSICISYRLHYIIFLINMFYRVFVKPSFEFYWIFHLKLSIWFKAFNLFSPLKDLAMKILEISPIRQKYSETLDLKSNQNRKNVF